METIQHFFNINNILFTAWGYQMSYLEFFGTIFNLWSVYLVVRNNILTWPVGIVGVVLFGALFYQIRLYSDLFEQIYFLITSFYGWWVWLYLGRKSKLAGKGKEAIGYSSFISILIYGGIIVIGTFAMGYGMAHIHVYLPKFFPEAASFPYLDAVTTVMSFAATILMAHKKIECWYLWILVDIIGVGLYFAKGVVFVSLLYFIFLILATKGLFEWRKILSQP